ncbi:putative ribonuclease H-like domain-containing protein [Tanacetum coccineum]
MSSNFNDIQAAGSDTHPPMLDRTDYDLWSLRIRLYYRGKENGIYILQSIDHGPFDLGTTRDTLGTTPKGGVLLGPKRPRTYDDLNDNDKKRFVRNEKNIIRDLKQQRDKLDLAVIEYNRQKEECQKTQMIFKQTQHDKEEKYFNDILQLQAKNKYLENIVCKMGKSTETLRLLTNEQKTFWDNLRKSGLGYNGPYVLLQAYAKIPKLYRAYELRDNNEQLHVFDYEETLEDAEKSRLKMNEFQKDEKVQELKIKPIDYAKLNKLYDDFVPQKESSAEQTYFPSSFISSKEFFSEKKPSMASMPSANPMLVNLNEMENVFKKLFELLEKNSKRTSIFYTSLEELRLIDICVEAKLILQELHLYFEIFQNRFKRDVKEMKDVFVSVENDLDETLKQNEFLKDRLLEASLAEDVKNLVITSCVEIRNKDLHDEIERISKESKDVSNESKTADTVCNDAFEVTQELSKRIVELEKDLSKFEAKSIAFEIALQHKSRVETNECDEVKVKVNFDEIETKNIELEHRVASLIKENEHLKFDFTKANVFADEEKRATLGKLNAFDKENCDFRSKVTHLEKIIAQKSKDFDDVKLELSNRTSKFEAYSEKLKSTKVVLERQLAHYPIWEVKQKGNGLVSVSKDTNDVIKVLPPKTAEEILAREREKKARTTLLMALTEDHLAKFHKMTDAKEMWDTIKSRFGGNDESKKMHKYILKQQFEGFSVSPLKMPIRSSLGLYLLPGPKVFESDIKGSTGSSSNARNVAFVSSESTSSTNDVSIAYAVSTSSGYNLQREDSSSYTDELMYSFFANQSSGPHLDHEDLEQLDEFDLEEMDLKWQVVMISMRLKKFYKKTGRKLYFDAKELVGFDKTKVECYNYNRRRPGKEEEPKALVTLDGEGVDWIDHAEDEQENFALMAYSNSGSDTEVKSCSKECVESYVKLKKLYDEQREQLGDANIEIQAYTQALKKSSDVEDSHVHDRFANVEGMHTVPPQMTRNYMPSGPDREIDNSMFTYGPKQYKTSESDTQTIEPNVVSQPKVWPDAPIIEEYESDSDDEYENLQRALKNKGIVDSGCSRHMTRNKAYLLNIKTIMVALLLLEDFNLFSVSQMCDKKNKVLFTDTECLVLYSDFKLPDENQVLLRIPRYNNMYSFNIENIVPSGGLACLIATTTIDESNKWHRRLGHVNFKNLNKLVKGNLVRGLPSKIFQNDHTCVACQKGKQHKASCKAKSVSSISQPLQLLHMDLFGPTSIRSINHKTYCLFITDDFSRIHSKTKHIEIRHHFIRDAYEKKLIHVLKIHTDDNVANLLTKAFNVSSPTIYASYIEQFWNTATSKTVNSVKQIHAIVNDRAVVISESSVRNDLLFDDEDGITCLTNDEIFENLTLMGNEQLSTKLTFQKGSFSPQWKFLIHTILHCISSKSTAWNEFSTNLASAVICLANGQKFNFSKLIFDGMLRNLDPKKFLMYPRFLHLFLNNQLKDLPKPFNCTYETPCHTKKVFTNMARKGVKFLGKVTPLFDSMLVPHQAPEGEGSKQPTEPQPTPSPTHASTGDQPLVTDSSSSHDTIQDFRDSLENTNRSEGTQVQSSYDSPLSGDHTSKKAEGGLNLEELFVLCTNLSNRVLALETSKDAQAAEILKLKDQIKKLRRKLGRKESVSKQGRKNAKPEPTLDAFDDLDADGRDYIKTEDVVKEERQSNETEELNKGSGEKGGSIEELVSTTVPKTVSTARPELSTARPDVDAARQEDSMKEEKAKEKGVSIKDIEDSSRPARSILTLKPLPTINPKDKGKSVLEEPEPAKKMTRSDFDAAQIARDAEIARQLQVDLQAEVERERQREEEASKAAIAETYDEVQAGIDADALFAAKLQHEEREEYTIEERAKFLAETIAAQRKFRVAPRSAEIRSRPPTKSQLRNLMMTYLKNMSGYKHSQLKAKTFAEIQGLYERQKRVIDDFKPMDSDDAVKDSKEAAGVHKQKVLEEPNSTKVEVKQEGHEDKEEQLKAFLKIVPDEEGIIDYEVLEKRFPIINWESKFYDFDRHGAECIYYRIFRSDGSSRWIKTFSEMVTRFDRSRSWFKDELWQNLEEVKLKKLLGLQVNMLILCLRLHSKQEIDEYEAMMRALAISEQMATGKEISNPFMASSLPKTTKPT